MRSFELVKEERLRSSGIYSLPVRGTAHSAGYDFRCPYDVTVEPGRTTETIWTGIKAKMEPDEVLLVFIRSSRGFKGLRIKNGTMVIDSDYYGNPETDGDIGVRLQNLGGEPVTIKAGERFCQGVFTKYLTVDDDRPLAESRKGGYGSTGD